MGFFLPKYDENIKEFETDSRINPSQKEIKDLRFYRETYPDARLCVIEIIYKVDSGMDDSKMSALKITLKAPDGDTLPAFILYDEL